MVAPGGSDGDARAGVASVRRLGRRALALAVGLLTLAAQADAQTFWLTDGTTLRRPYFVETSELMDGVILPVEFRRILDRYLGE